MGVRSKWLNDFVRRCSRLQYRLVIQGNKNIIELFTINAPERHRGSGTGTRILQELIAHSESTGIPIKLMPSEVLGGDIERLRSWYRRLGFRPTRGEYWRYTPASRRRS